MTVIIYTIAVIRPVSKLTPRALLCKHETPGRPDQSSFQSAFAIESLWTYYYRVRRWPAVPSTMSMVRRQTRSN